MEESPSILARFPLREFELRRLRGRDATFRSICLDYEVAVAALAHWRQMLNDGEAGALPIIEDYSRLIKELETEILTKLNRSSPDN